MRSKLLFVVVCVALLCVFFRVVKPDKRTVEESSQAFDKLVKTVYFEGEVLSTSVYNNSTLLCIRIDTASVDSFYYFSRGGWALCIRDGVAVMPIGMVDKYDSVYLFKVASQQVVLNKAYSGKTLFIRGTDTLPQDLNLWSAKLEEVHLLTTREDARNSVCREKHP